ncbi:MAG TPA: DUF6160 family protein [Candidatus Macondimonas sp.]|nr:DUF6160 family protein [Candidatus Macondimonas sp.]
MKLKSLSVLGLLAAAPMASQAAMVEMNETEMSDVSGQISFSGNFDFDFGASYTVYGYEVDKTVYGSGNSTSNWAFGKNKEVYSPYSSRTYYKSKEIGNDYGEKYIATYKSWGRYND